MIRQNPRDVIVRQADLEIRKGLAITLDYLHIKSWPDILYHIAIIKAILLAEMGATVGPEVRTESIPDDQHVLAAACYGPMMQFGLTSAELYQIITDWELREAYGMVKQERSEDVH